MKFLSLFVLVLYSSLLSAQCDFKVIGHRGGSSYYFPENTVVALEQGFLEDIYAAEIDVRCTSDSVLVLMHDYYIDRTTNGTGNIAELPYSYISTLDAGSWKDPSFAGVKVPTLAEVLLLAQKYHKKLYLNMKVYVPHLIAKVLDETKVSPDIIIVDPTYMYEVKEYHQILPNTPIVYFGAPPSDIDDATFYEDLKNNGVIAAEIPADYIGDSAWVDEYKEHLASKGIELWAYTVNQAEYMRSLKAFGINGLETDRGAQAKEIFCEDGKEGFYPEKRITGQWDFDSTLLGTKGSQLTLLDPTASPSAKVAFSTCDSFHIPRIQGENVPVAKINALNPDQALRFYSNFFPEGRPSVSDCNNSYSVIFDLLKPHSDKNYISIFQTSNNNSNDGDLFITQPGNKIGILEQYHGTFADSTWNRLVFVFDLNKERLDKYINGIFVGTTVLSNSMNGRFCINNNWGVQSSNFFSDEDGETADLFVSSVQIRNYAMPAEEVASLGAVSSGKISDTIFNKEECPAISDFSKDTIVTEGASLNLYVQSADSVNYRWQINKGDGWVYITDTNFLDIASDTLIINQIPASMNQYRFRCLLSNDCRVFSNEIKLSVLETTGVSESFISEAEVYPNPNNGTFYIRLKDQNSTIEVSLLNSMGQIIENFSVEESQSLMKISAKLNPGIYFVRVKNDGKVSVSKIFVNEN